MEFAMLMKNKVRPLGSFALGRACHLMGTGMALPWTLMSSAHLATGHIAEDMKLGIELTLQGKPARFLPDVHITSPFVEDTSVAKAQKSRWEHGHLAVMAEELPLMIGQAIRRREPALIVLAMDLMIPPIAFYFMLLSALLLLSIAGAWFFDGLLPMAWVASAGFSALALSVFMAWWFYGKHLLSARELLATPFYALWKLPVVYIIENNRYAMGTSVNRASAQTDFSRRGLSFNIPGEQVDGMDIRAVKAAGERAMEHARSGKGPYILEMQTYRYRGHSMSDPAKYRSKDEVQKMREEHDPIEQVRARLINHWKVAEDELKAVDAKARDVVNDAAEFATHDPEPDVAELYTDILL
jgi:hypothetical protein